MDQDSKLTAWNIDDLDKPKAEQPAPEPTPVKKLAASPTKPTPTEAQVQDLLRLTSQNADVKTGNNPYKKYIIMGVITTIALIAISVISTTLSAKIKTTP